MADPPARLTISDVARYPRPGMSVPGMLRFSPDGRHLNWLHAESGDLVRSLWQINLETGERSVLAGPERAAEPISREEELRRERTRTRELGVPAYAWARDAAPSVLMIPGPVVRIARGDEDLHELNGTDGAVDPTLSVDGSTLSFVRGGNLFVMPTDGSSAPTQLTHDAEDGLTFGLADYIAQEEFGQLHGHWWSRDGSQIALIRVDSRKIAPYPIVHQGSQQVDVETHRYPFSGDPNAEVALGVIPASGGNIHWLPLPEGDGYLVRVAWWPMPECEAGRLVVQWLDRDQRRLRLIAFEDLDNPTVLIDEQQHPWINIADDARGLTDGRFLWSSEQTGFRHLSIHAADGRKERDLTSGDWIVDGVIGIDEASRKVYFTSTRDSALTRQVERVSLDGGEPERLSDSAGVSGGVLSDDGRWLALLESSLESPPAISLLNLQSGSRRTLYESDLTPADLGLRPPQLRRFAAPDGATLFGAIYEPDPAVEQPPLLVAVYGGPHAQTVLDAWALTVDLRAQYLAQQGYLVLKLDNRGMAGRGLAFESHLDRRMGTVEVDDQAAAVQALAQAGEIDPQRVGIYGWSYGGYMTVMSMLRRPDLFKVGVSGAPVSDWDGYDTGYTERYMGTPQDNAEGYREGSLLTHADQLKGKLLLVHGGVDENVHFRHTARLITALTQADRDYDLLLFPSERHMPRDQAGLEYQEARVARYFDRHLKGKPSD